MGLTLTPAQYAKSEPSAGGAFSSRWRSRATARSNTSFWAGQNRHVVATLSNSCLHSLQVANRTNALEGVQLPDSLGRAGQSSTRTAATCGIVAPDAACKSVSAGCIVDGACGTRSSTLQNLDSRPYVGGRVCYRGPCQSLARAGAVDGRGHGRLGRCAARCGRRVLERGWQGVKRACAHLRREGAFGHRRVRESAKRMSRNRPA
jgi:hypothetical protein